MSRETDSSSSGPQGRGGAAYPSGTPPYGPRPFPSLHPQEQARAAGQEQEPAEGGAEAADEPRTETTLTTRIRINIPGSRPIPPVVMRTTVEDGAVPPAAGASAAGGTARAGAADAADARGAESAPEGEQDRGEKKEKTSDWFAPRKPVGPTGTGASGGEAPGEGSFGGAGQGLPGGPDESARPTTITGTGAGAGAPVPGFPPGQPAGDGFSEGFTGDGFQSGGAPASGGTAGGGFTVPSADRSLGDGFQGGFLTGGAPGSEGTDGGGFTLPPPNGPADDGYFGAGTPAGGTPSVGDPAGDPFAAAFGESFADPDTGTQQIPQAFLPPPAGSPFDGGPAARGPHDTPAGGFAPPFDTGAGQDFRTEPAPFGTDGFPPRDPGSAEPFGTDGGGAVPPAQPTGATTGPATGEMRVPPLGEDPFERAFRPQAPAGSEPQPGPSVTTGLSGPAGLSDPAGPSGPGGLPGAAGPAGPSGPGSPRPSGPSGPRSGPRGSGDTLVGGIPPVPSGEDRPGPPPGAGPVPAPAPAPAATAPAPAAASAKPAKKGRSKVVLLGVAVGGAVVLAYGAGLLMNHSDVPKGTTVLGVDIGNTSQETAVKTLDQALGNRGTADLSVTVGGKQHTLKPSIAGLSIDTDATVRKVAHSDYNPVSVIGSLFGQTRTASPVILVDEDKLKAALTTLAGKPSSGSDGMVRFADGKAVAVPGKPGQSVDVNTAADQVSAAYRLRAQSGRNTPIALKATTVQPKVTQAQLTTAVNGFGRTAMMGPVYVTAGYHTVKFDSTLPQFLSMRPTPDGTLEPYFDLKALKSLYGSTFDGVLLERGNGSKTAVTPQDIATALVSALKSTSAGGRSVTLPNVAQ